MVTCHKCGRKNEDRYKFCLGCGAQLGAPAAEPAKPVVAVPSVSDASEGRPTSPSQPVLFPMPGAAVVAAQTPIVSAPSSIPSHEDATLPDRAEPRGAQLRESTSGVVGTAGTIERASLPAAPSIAYTSPLRASVEVPAVALGPKRICRKCGTELPPGYLFCGRCGSRFEEHAPDFATGAIPAVSPNTETASPVRGRLVLIHPDGAEGDSIALVDGENLLGADSIPVLTLDEYVSPQHFKVTCGQGMITVEDNASVNGVFVRLGADPVVLLQGDQIRIGQELFRFVDWEQRQPVLSSNGSETWLLGGPEVDGWGLLELVVGLDAVSNAYVLDGEEQLVGRESGQIVLRDDGFVSGRHARLRPSPTGVTLQDLESSNGTYIRLRRPYRAKDGDFFLVGQQLFLLHTRP